MTLKGIDISKWQSNVDWNLVKKSDVSFAILRCSYGTSTDKLFKTHITNALKSDINVGVYCYSIALTVKDALKEADKVISIIKSYNISFPVCFDMEDQRQLSLSNEQRTDIAIAFLKRIEEAGYYAMLYSNRDWLTYKYNMSRLSQYDVWLAEWTSEAKYAGNYGIWQYGVDFVEGIGVCDCNIAYKNYPEIISNMKKPQTFNKEITAGKKVYYKGYIHSSSFGFGRKVYVNGNFFVNRVIKYRPYGILLGSFGWVNKNNCKIID